MPKFLEEKLEAAAAKKGFKGKRADKYVYGAMNNMGAMRGSKETAKGQRMDQKHQADMQATSGYHGSAANYKHSRPKQKKLTRNY